MDSRASNSSLRVAVVGGGIMGACTSLVLAQSGHRVFWYAPPEPARRADGAQARAYALAPATVALLEDLGVWQQVGARARAVVSMEVYARNHDARPVVLSEGDLLAAHGVRHPLAQILGHADLLDASVQCARNDPRITHDSRFPVDIAVGGEVALAALGFDDAQPAGSVEGSGVRFDLVIGCDGAGSFVRRRAGLLWGVRDYGQSALVMAFESAQAHQGTACQWFAEDSVLALLPLEHDRQLSMVYSLPTTEAHDWVKASPQALAQRVSEDSGHRWGTLTPLSPVVSSALAMTLVPRSTVGRLALVGDAAHSVHPLAGYGLNLGMQDLHALRAALPQLTHHAVSVPLWVSRFGQERQRAAQKIQWGLDGLWRATRLEGPGVSAARQIVGEGLRRLPALRRWLIRQAMGPQAAP